MRVGHGTCGAHHGELLQGFFDDGRGAVRPGLVTLPVPGAAAHATFRPGPGPLTVVPAGRAKARRAAELTLAAVGAPGSGGGLVLRSAVPTGLGMGSSTADVVATVRAVADACGVAPSPRTVARLAVAAEAASDPLMFDGRPRLFAHRDGDVLETLGEHLPPLRVLGCLLDGGAPVDTPLERPAEPPPVDVEAYAELRARLRRAVASADPVLLGGVATASAVRARPSVLPLRDLAVEVGATGVQIAHSGSVAGLLFDAGVAGSVVRRAAAALRAHGLVVTRDLVVGGTSRWTSRWTATSPTPSADRISSASPTG